MMEAEEKMSLSSHLLEVRRRLFACLCSFLLGMGLCLWKAKPFSEALISRAPFFSFVYTSPAELFVVYMKIAVTGGVTCLIPVFGYEVWRFMKPGLHKNERDSVGGILFFGLLLFGVGAFFAFQVVLPISLQFFYGLNGGAFIAPMMSIQNYVGYVLEMMIAFGAVFELPIVVMLLTGIGIIRPEFLKHNRKYMILVIFVLAAIITPPDITSQILIAVPMLALFEVSIVLAQLTCKRKAKRQTNI